MCIQVDYWWGWAGATEGRSSLKIRHLGRAEPILFLFVSSKRVCLLSVQVRFPLNA